MAKKMTMKELERTKADQRADKSGRHGPEGSKKDIRMDKALLAKFNKGRK